MTRKYTITEKRKLKDISSADWFLRLNIAILLNQGLTLVEVAKRYNSTKQNIFQIYKKIKNMNIEELEEMTKKYEHN
jgi:predicted transcriptional regulator